MTDRIVQLAQVAAMRSRPCRVSSSSLSPIAPPMKCSNARAKRCCARDLAPEVLGAFNRAWFGTIHAFCFKLLNEYGHYLGLPAPLELLADDEDLWNEFVQQQTLVGRSLSRKRSRPSCSGSLRSVTSWNWAGAPVRPCSIRINPANARRSICRSCTVHSSRCKKSDTVANSMAQLKAWENDYRERHRFSALADLHHAKRKQIDELWAETFAPLRRWVNQTAICVAAEVQRDYRNFRLERGVVTYADQIALADELLQHPEAARRLRQLDPIVILDEAQDTDPAQFSVLLEITRPPEATGRWLQTRVDPPRPGRFCMVGDFQQSIWHDRADLAHYQRVHDALVSAEAGDALTFSVTFRLDQRQIDFINDTFRDILNGDGGQVNFVELQPRPNVLPGQVIRISLGSSLLEGHRETERPPDRAHRSRAARRLAEGVRPGEVARAQLAPGRDSLSAAKIG